MRRLYFTLLLLPILFSIPTKSQVLFKEAGARSSALGYTGVCTSNLWAQFNNQAGLANVRTIQCGISYTSRYQLKELGTKSIAIVAPIYNSCIGVSLSKTGDHIFNQTNLGLSIAKKLSGKLGLGIGFNYFSLNQSQNLGSVNKINFEGGLILDINRQLSLGLHMYNPKLKQNNQYTFKLPEIYKFGISYKINASLISYAEVKYHSDYNSSIHFGIEYINKYFIVRTGYSSNPDKLSFGLGILYKKISLNISNTLHNTLGHTPQLTLVYKF